MSLNVHVPPPFVSAPRADRIFIIIPAVVCAYDALISPLLIFFTADSFADQIAAENSSRIENKIFWPLVLFFSIAMSRRRIGQLKYIKNPTGLLLLSAYVALAGFSILWSVEPLVTERRTIHEVMVLLSVVLPVALSDRRDKVFSDLFICFSAVAVINLIFVLAQPPTPIGHAGIYNQKNAMGANVALSYIFALHEIFRGGILRRAFAMFIVGVSLFLLVASQSKTSLGLAVLAPLLGIALVALVRLTTLSPAWIVLYFLGLIFTTFIIGLDAQGLSVDDVSMFLFGDDTFTGRTTIWTFAVEMLQARPVLGWGYQAFWSESLDSPARLGPGWVALMTHGHNGYIDTFLGTGLIGFVLLLGMIVSAFISSRTIIRMSVRGGWLIMSLMIFVILHNGLETTFLRSASTLWVVFVILLTFVAVTTETRIRRPAERPSLIRA